MGTPEIKDLQVNDSPVVSVAITAYNSERWIAKAIESALMQKTNFPFEIVIADDCSKDGTLSIANTFRAQHPNIIRILERTSNLGTQRNYFDLFEQSRGKYIAWLDADDYWTDTAKLQSQVDVLESDSTITICIHYVRWMFRDGEVQRERFPTLTPGRHGMEDVLKSNFLPSPSVMFRNGLHRSLPAWYFDVSPLTDWPLYVVAALEGDIFLMDRVMADYTLNTTSALWGKGGLFWYKIDADFYERVESIVPKKYHRLIGAEKGKRYEEIAYALRKDGDFTGSRQAAMKAFCAPALLDNSRSKGKSLLASIVREAQWRIGRR